MKNDNDVRLSAIEPSVLEKDIDLTELFAVLMSGRWVVFVALIFGAAIAFIYTTLATPMYSADALIQIERQAGAYTGLSDLAEVLPADSGIGAEVEIIKSRSILKEVVEKFRLDIQLKGILGTYFGRAVNIFPSVDTSESALQWRSGNGDVGKVKQFTFTRLEHVGVEEPLSIMLEYMGGGSFKYHAPGSYGIIKEGEFFEISGVEYEVSGRLDDVVLEKGDEFQVNIDPVLYAARRLRDKLNVSEVGRDTGVMRVALDGENRKLIKSVLEGIAQAYVKRNVERRSEEAKLSLDFLRDQLPNVRADLEAAENRLASFREKNRTIDLTIETASVLEEVVNIDQRLYELDLKRTDLMRSYTKDHPLLKTLDEQSNLLVAEKRKLQEKSKSLPEIQQELLRLVREVEVTTQLYTFMLNKTQELSVVQAGTIGNVRILDHAEVNPVPVRPRKFLVFVFSIFSMAALAVMGLFIRYKSKAGIAEPNEVESTLSSPVYSVLPQSEVVDRGSKRERRPVVVAEPESVIAEAFRSLRTSLHFSLMPRSGCPVISISGPAPNVGKTFVSVNLALTLAGGNKNVLFIDGDMRRGDADSRLFVARSPGLSELWSSNPGFTEPDYIQSCKFNERLHVISRGKSPPNPAELIMNGNLLELISKWRKVYDYIVIDTPPVLAVTDPVLFSTMTDALFIVGRVGSTKMEELLESKKRFEKAGVGLNGVIINGMTKALAAGGRYGQNYGYYNYSYQRGEK